MTHLSTNQSRSAPPLLLAIPGFLLGILMVWAVVKSVADAYWAPDLRPLLALALPAVAVGTLFALVRWIPAWLAHVMAGALGLVWAVQQLAPQMDERLRTWNDQAAELVIRTIIWARVLLGGGRGEDLLLFVAALSLLSGLLGYTTAWFVFRRGWGWAALLLNAVVMLVNYTYTEPKPTSLFFVFLAAGVVLLVYQQILFRQARWNDEAIEYPDFLPLRFVWAAALTCFAVVVATAWLPQDSTIADLGRAWKTVSQPFRQAREYWEDAFSTISAPPGTSGVSFAARSAQLGGARTLGTLTVMTVQSPRFDYWRAVAFDRYDGRGWQNTAGEQARAALGFVTPEQARVALGAGQPLALRETRATRVVTQTVTLLADRKDDLITVGGQARAVSVSTMVEMSLLSDPQRPNFDDVALIIARESLRNGMVYTVTALASLADEQSLRAVRAAEYPDWVRERYLQLPTSVSERTRALARDLVQAAGATNAYDAALAIQNYLRTLTYNENISAPPPNGDPIDYFLFERREGYCDYFASAMVVMLRSLDIPARWVQGYAGGELDPTTGLFVVRENLAHTWPEVYFPTFGWQRFEPTPASYTALPNRPATPLAEDGSRPFTGTLDLAPNPRFREDLDPGLVPDRRSTGGGGNFTATTLGDTLRQVLGTLGILLGLSGLGGVLAFSRWRYEVRGLGAAGVAYAQLALFAGWVGLGQHPSVTPQEYGARLRQALPFDARAITTIVDAYEHERYARTTPNEHPTFEAELRQLRKALLQYRWRARRDAVS